ncbi:MAG TPA: lysylphosphatidylglycerol synthase domain-containing protein [Acidimicrobiia bacterium]|nr:lysylphosphatidylglycerol synthase domain-containing protein [Acidimicrobiia bacterium]
MAKTLERMREPRELRHRAFGHADEHPFRRLTGDWVRVGAATALLLLSARHVGDDTRVEQDVSRFFAQLPDGAHGLFTACSRLGSLWAVLLVAAAALLARRWRLALVLVVAGAIAWFVGRLMGFLVAGASVGAALADVFHPSKQPVYPTIPLALTAAVILAAAPFLTRPTRRVGELFVLLVALGTLYRSDGSLNAIFAGFVLGWGVAAVVHLAFGSPAGRPTTAQITAALSELGVDVAAVELAPVQARGFTRVVARRADGALLPVRVYGRDAADTQLLAKLYRFVFYKDSGATLTITRLQQVEHEALCQLVASEAGAHVPELLAAGVAGPGAALLVTGPVEGRTLGDEADPDAALRELWADVARLQARRVAHGALDLEHVVVVDGAPTIVDFSNASVSALPQRLDRDVAQLLVSSALVVGDERAVAAARDGIGSDALGAALPLLSKPALTSATRHALRHDKKLLENLQQRVSGATGVEVPAPIELRRVKPMTIAILVGLLFALWAILAQVGSISELFDTLKTADWAWVIVAALLTQTTQVAYALTTIGSVDTKIPLGPAILMQYAVAFTNMILPTGAASTVMNIRFLQKQGVGIAVATSSGVLCGLSGTVAQFVLFVATAFAIGQSADLDQIGGSGDDALILLVVVLVALVVGVVFFVPRLRRLAVEKVWPQFRSALRNLWHVFTTPRQLVLVLGGSFGAQILNAFGLGAALLAYGGHLPIGELLFVVTGAGFLSSLVPVPGGIGVAEATLIAGLTAFGVAPEVASAAVVTYRLFTTYLPPIPGSYATKWLVANDDL